MVSICPALTLSLIILFHLATTHVLNETKILEDEAKQTPGGETPGGRKQQKLLSPLLSPSSEASSWTEKALQAVQEVENDLDQKAAEPSGGSGPRKRYRAKSAPSASDPAFVSCGLQKRTRQ